MLKFRDIIFPALGGTGVLLGAAYGTASRDYGANQIEQLTARVQQVEAQASKARETVAAAQVRAASASADLTVAQSELASLQEKFAQNEQKMIAAENKFTAAQQRAESAASRAANLAAQLASAQASTVVVTPPAAPAQPVQPDAVLGLGRAALPQEIAAWDVDVLPDGRGLPEGSGDVFTGEEVFAEKCASCHGDFAEGVDNWPVLAGGFDTLADKDPVKTVGSYWPHLSTVWDYVHRSMPFGEAGTLSADETYAIVAYILYSNDLVDDDFELNRDNFNEIVMHNEAGFRIDDRPDTEYTLWRTEPCMSNCKDEVKITKRASVLDVTPEADKAEAPVQEQPEPEQTKVAETAAPETAPAPAAEEPPVVAAVADPDPALVAKGEKVFRKCKACHQVGEGAKNRTGPQLNGVIGGVMGSVEGFKYSKGFVAAHEEGRIWDATAMAEFLTKPRGFMKGTKMSFNGLKKQADIDAVIAYLQSFAK